MNETLLQSWWLLAVRGLVATIFGGLAIAWPAITLLALSILFAAFALIGGAVWVFGAVRNRRRDLRWWVLLVLGLTSMAAGAIAALYPGLTTVALVLVVGANALVTGILDIVVAVRVRKFIRDELLLALAFQVRSWARLNAARSSPSAGAV